MAVVCCAMNFDLDPDGCGSNLLTRTLNITSPRATGRNGSNCRTRMDALNYLVRIGNNQHGFILRSSTVFCLIEIPCLSDNMCFRTWCTPYFSGYEFGCSSCRQSTQIRVESSCFFWPRPQMVCDVWSFEAGVPFGNSNMAIEHLRPINVGFDFNGKIIYEWWIVHCHVWLPEGKLQTKKMNYCNCKKHMKSYNTWPGCALDMTWLLARP